MDRMTERFLLKQGVYSWTVPQHWSLEECAKQAAWGKVRDYIKQQDEFTQSVLRVSCAVALRNIGVNDIDERWAIAQDCVDLVYGLDDLTKFERTFEF